MVSQMKMKHLLITIIGLFFTFVHIETLKAFFNPNANVAYAISPFFGWKMIGDEEVAIFFETSLTSRVLSAEEFNDTYGYNFSTDIQIREQWCEEHTNSSCEMRFVGAFLPDGTMLPVVPELMYY